MVSRLATELLLPISQERIERYRPRGGSDLDMLANYMWNLALSEALQPCLQSCEVALRNSIHSALTSANLDARWFDRPELLLARERKAVRDAEALLIRNNKPLNPGRVVAELQFGFWTSLLSRPYETQIWRPENLAVLRTAFPHVPSRYRSRARIWARCDHVRRLRNRVMHCEPVFDRPLLLDEHQQILETIGWISPSLRDLIVLMDRFPQVYRDGPAWPRTIIQAFMEHR